MDSLCHWCDTGHALANYEGLRDRVERRLNATAPRGVLLPLLKARRLPVRRGAPKPIAAAQVLRRIAAVAQIGGLWRRVAEAWMHGLARAISTAAVAGTLVDLPV